MCFWGLGGAPKCAKMPILRGGQGETLKSGVFWGFGGGPFGLQSAPNRQNGHFGGVMGVPKSTLIISVTGLPRGTLPICSKPGPGGELVSVPDFHIWGGGVPTFRGPQILHAH